ncbi:hypothetical protein B0H65DRAFT_586383 [Neurospora tetraspora]|uniref:ER-bound oxygenase mpaB/mpaB'/Rubber oxygenase catalytic domain-containing protein n=1 Tax=Neurospora tetraspora TaxID=94610 RepID=A0AAE0MU15_9PEZI|nr:hypothetical protein B0H65DRAFT_586383 [Neurospora tetraspora]
MASTCFYQPLESEKNHPFSRSTPPTPPESFALLSPIVSTLLLWSGGPYTLLLQISHPSIALGSCKHSRFAHTTPSKSSSRSSSSDFEVTLSRLRRTSAYILAVSLGTPEQKRVIVDIVRKQHAFVRGSGTCQWKSAHGMIPSEEKGMAPAEKIVKTAKTVEYDAADGELQKWVAATLFLGVSLDMPSEMWPDSMEKFDAYVEETVQERLVVTEEARKLAKILLWDVRVPWWMRWVLPIVRVFMACWLPSGLREGYGLPDPKEWWVSGCYFVLVWVVSLVDLVIPRIVNDAVFGLMRRDRERAVEGVQRTDRWTI